MKGKKTGGRTKGTPNKDNPLKGFLRSHSEQYFTPRKRKIKDENGKEQTLTASDFEMDLCALIPNDRITAEIKILEFHSPKMKSVDVDMTQDVRLTIEDRLSTLAMDPEDEEE